METESKQLKSENETLKHENAELREINNKLKQSLDESVRNTKPQPAPRRLKPSSSESRGSPETVDISTHSELQRKYIKAIEELSETRQQLVNVQERLTVTEKVTAATQRRELDQESVYQDLPSDSIYEKLRFDRTQEHNYTALLPPMHTGCIPLFSVAQCSSDL